MSEVDRTGDTDEAGDSGDSGDSGDVGDAGSAGDAGGKSGEPAADETFAPSGSFAVASLMPPKITSASQSRNRKKRPRLASAGRGHRADAVESDYGPCVGVAKPVDSARDIALAGTLRAAALRQAASFSQKNFSIQPSDLRVKARRARRGNLLLFVVDSSGSMGARKRMSLVKGVMMTLLLDAYQKRDLVGLISFRGAGARLLVPPTNSVDVAERQLRHLPTGGRTPLGDGLLLAAQTLERYALRDVALTSMVVLITDGRSNVGIDPLVANGRLLGQGVPLLVIDSEQGYVRMGAAAQLARGLGARYLSIDGLQEHAQDGQRLRSYLRF